MMLKKRRWTRSQLKKRKRIARRYITFRYCYFLTVINFLLAIYLPRYRAVVDPIIHICSEIKKFLLHYNKSNLAQAINDLKVAQESILFLLIIISFCIFSYTCKKWHFSNELSFKINENSLMTVFNFFLVIYLKFNLWCPKINLKLP